MNGDWCSCKGLVDPSNADLVQAIATRPEARIGGAVVGVKKHAYADRLLQRYQAVCGDRGLVAEQSFLSGAPVVPRGTPGNVRLDVNVTVEVDP